MKSLERAYKDQLFSKAFFKYDLTETALMMSPSYFPKYGASLQTTLQALVLQRLSRSMGVCGGHVGIDIRRIRIKLATVTAANMLWTKSRNQPRLHDVFLRTNNTY